MFKNKLGKRPFKFDSRSLKLKHYISATYVPPPYVSYTWGIKDWGMMINGPDPGEPELVGGIGDCTIAACGHAIQTWTHGNITPSDPAILSAYEKWCGYVFGDPTTDQGGYPTDVLNNWRKNTFDGHVLKAFVSPQPQNFRHIQISIAEFGGVYIGLQLPYSALDQNDRGEIWDVVANDGGIAGGHAIWCNAYHTNDPTQNKATTIGGITWGGVQKMTLAFWNRYCDESYALYANAWTTTNINTTQLMADLDAVNN